MSQKGKRLELLRDKQFEKLMERVSFGDLETGQGLNQEATLKRLGDTRWNFYYFTIVSLINLFSSVVGVLEHLQVSVEDAAHSGQATTLLRNICCFEFAFVLHLMKFVLGITLDLSLVLQRKDQDLVNAMKLVKIAKERLQELREHGWENLVKETTSYCVENDILVSSMNDNFIIYSRDGRVCRRGVQVSNLIHYRVELFYVVIACLDPIDSFAAFDKKALIKLAMFCHYRVELFYVVYLLIKLSLILPVATATVERIFSAMNLVKSELRNRLGDDMLNNSLGLVW